MSDDTIDLGPCCACGGTENVRNILMLDKKSPMLGRGWGCVACGLPADGASAVVCDQCLEEDRPLRYACRGYPGKDGRVEIGELQGEHEHDMSMHPEVKR